MSPELIAALANLPTSIALVVFLTILANKQSELISMYLKRDADREEKFIKIISTIVSKIKDV